MAFEVSLETLNALIHDLGSVHFADSTVELRYYQNLIEQINNIKSMNHSPEENYKALQALFSSETDPAIEKIKSKVVKKLKEFIPEFEAPHPLLHVTAEEWAKAEKYFAENPPSHPGETKKMSKTKTDEESPENPHSFIMVKGEIYAVANRRIYTEKAPGRLGEGSSSIVKVIQNKKGENFALKIEGMDLRPENDEKDPYIIIMNILGFGGQAVRHLDDEIVFKGEDTSNKLYTVLNLVEGKDLFEYIHGPLAATINAQPTKKLMLALSICKAVQELHDKRIIHGDLNPGNFMVMMRDQQILVQLIDFVLSMKLKEGKNEFISKFKGSARYMAPEVISEQARFSFASDAFALGRLFEKDLRLPDKFYEGLLESDPKKRDSLNKVMLALVEELEKYPDLDPKSKKFISEYKIQLIENIEKQSKVDAELKAREPEQAEELQPEQSTTTPSNPIAHESEPITWKKLEDIGWQIMRAMPPPAGISERKLEHVKSEIDKIQEYIDDNNGGDQAEIIKKLRALFIEPEHSLNDKEKTFLEKIIKEFIPTFQAFPPSSPSASPQNKALVFSTITANTNASLPKSDALATERKSQDVSDHKPKFTN